MLSVIGFLVILAPLVIFHELGHFLFARLFGVKAEVFSVGFGPRIWSRVVGETEWRLSAVPLGGYVKLLGEETDDGQVVPPELANRTLQSKPPWQRFFIFLGGPLFNFVLAVLIFALILVVGEPQVANRIGRVTRGSEAEKMGFQSGDRVLAIDGKPIQKFEEILLHLNETGSRSVVFGLERAESPKPGARVSRLELEVKPATREGFSVYGEQKDVGEIDGIFPNPRSTEVGVSNPQSPAGRLGLTSGDRVVRFDGVSVDTWEQVEALYAAAPMDRPIEFWVERDGKAWGGARSLVKPKRWRGPGEDWGLYSSELFVEKTVEGSPAERAGIQRGDRLVSVGGQLVLSFFDLKDAIQHAGEKAATPASAQAGAPAGSPVTVEIAWERAGKAMSARVEPTQTTGRDALLRKVTAYTIGVAPQLVWREAEMVIERVLNPFTLLYRSVTKMAVLSWRNLVSIKKMITGDVSVATLGGPILIGKIAGESIARGLVSFLTTMAVLSVGLGVLNLLPIPVLDGGHLLLLGIEAVRRRPLSNRQREVIQQVGFSLIVLLMVVVMKNDLSRLTLFH